MQVDELERLVGLPERRRETARRFLASAAIRKSPRLRALFIYLLEQSLRGESAPLREQQIGEDVFGKPQGYDTAMDNIVRVNVFLLRKKLERYFSEEGAEEPEVITIPKGRYAVEFLPRHIEAPAPPGVPENGSTRAGWPLWGVSAFVGVLILSAILLLWVWPNSRAPGATGKVPEHWRLWRTLFASDRDAYIVVADIGLSLLQDLTGATISLEQYLGKIDLSRFEGPQGLPPRLVERLSGRQYTAVSNASIAFRLGAINAALGGRAVVRAAQSIDIRDLKTHNIVLLGSERSNPWVSLLKPKMGLFIEYEGSPPRGVVRNLKPRPGEPELLRATAVGGSPGEAYGLISYLPNLDGTGDVVSIAGTNMEGTEAAAEMLLDDRRFRELMRALKVEDNTGIPYFEALIHASSIGGAGSDPKVVMARLLS
jgi:hypothetical protein